MVIIKEVMKQMNIDEIPDISKLDLSAVNDDDVALSEFLNDYDCDNNSTIIDEDIDLHFNKQLNVQ